MPSPQNDSKVEVPRAELETYRAFINDLGDAASSATLKHFRSKLAIDGKEGKADFDPVTIADREAEAAIRERIRQDYPDHTIIGEEEATTKGSGSYTWIIDPIDGTRSFVAGSPLWTTLIALAKEDKAFLSVIDQPYLNERYLGISTQETIGAWVTNSGGTTPINTSNCKSLSNAVMTCTARNMFTEKELPFFEAVDKQVRFTRFSMDAYGVALLAQGCVDLQVESDLALYDLQALIPIVKGAGGIITDWKGNPPYNGKQVLAAATPELHAEALAILKPGAD